MKNLFMVVICLMLASCTGGKSAGTANNEEGVSFEYPDLSDIDAFSTSSTHKNILKTCAQAISVDTSCLLNKMPLIGMNQNEVSKTQILDRLLVSHHWMGERFSQVLDNIPQDLVQLFQSVTMIVIDDDIRPSFYWAMTGAIYLDPSYLWLTNAEKAVINKKADFRSNHGSELPYLFAARYTKNERYAYPFYSLSDTRTRTFKDIMLPITSLLYHELAHANDIFPPTQFLNLTGRDQKIIEVAIDISQYQLSNSLSRLTSADMFGLAKIFYRGERPTSEQKNADLTVLGSHFQYDGATILYSYHTQYEDFAMLIEAAMMKHHKDVDMQVGFVKRPEKTDALCNDYLVSWGARNRMASASVKPRAIQAVKLMFPSMDLKKFLNNMDQETYMRIDEGWCSNIEDDFLTATIRKNVSLPEHNPYFWKDFLSPKH